MLKLKNDNSVEIKTMTIKQAVKKSKLKFGCSYYPYIVVNVGFLDNDGNPDETQLNLECHTGKDEDFINQLDTLFTSLVEEFNTKRNFVTYVKIIASAHTHRRLVEMGY